MGEISITESLQLAVEVESADFYRFAKRELFLHTVKRATGALLFIVAKEAHSRKQHSMCDLAGLFVQANEFFGAYHISRARDHIVHVVQI